MPLVPDTPKILHLVVQARLVAPVSEADGDLLGSRDLSRGVFKDASVARGVRRDCGGWPLVVRSDGHHVGHVASGRSRFAVVRAGAGLKVPVRSTAVASGAEVFDQGSKDGDRSRDDGGGDLGRCPDDQLSTFDWDVLARVSWVKRRVQPR